MTKHIGITGARTGPTRDQAEVLRFLAVTEVSRLVPSPEKQLVLHHGDCLGVDQAAHEEAYALGIDIVVHPPDNSRFRAFCYREGVVFDLGMTQEPEKPYRDRNQDIVNAADVLWAFPEGPEKDNPRSGTWMTVRMARRKGINIIVVHPDGSTTKEYPA